MFSTLFYYKHKSRATSWVPAVLHGRGPFSCLIYGPVVQVGVPVFCAPSVCQVVCGRPFVSSPWTRTRFTIYRNLQRVCEQCPRGLTFEADRFAVVATSGAAIAKKTPSSARVKQISRWDLTPDRDLREDSHAKYAGPRLPKTIAGDCNHLVFFLYKKGRTQNRSPEKGLFRVTPRSARERCRSWDFIAPRGSFCLLFFAGPEG